LVQADEGGVLLPLQEKHNLLRAKNPQ
jgi:hypothetical protein